jgi:hypothetical protein
MQNKVQKTDETGGQKITTEPYLVDALSYTEAESRINEEMSAYISEEFKITNIKVANAEIHPLKIVIAGLNQKSLLAYDEESGKERKTSMYFLVQANDVKEAFDTMGIMQSTMGEYSIPAISNLYYGCFSVFFWRREDLEKLKSLMHLKQLDLKLQQTEDNMESPAAQ